MGMAVSLLAAAMVWTTRLAAEDAPADAGADPYETYVKTSPDFKHVKQDKDWLYKAFPSWTYMPWYYQWKIGFNEAGAKFSEEMGYNGAFIDGRYDYRDGGAPRALDWIEKNKLRFYLDHTAGKHILHLWDGGQTGKHKKDISGTGLRPVELDKATEDHLKQNVKSNIDDVKEAPTRMAYSLDDETSWGVFANPCMWRVNGDEGQYKQWLESVYGKGNTPDYKGWISYNNIRKDLDDWSVGEFNCGQLMDQWSYNDSVYWNLIGDLVDYANKLDPHTPCGLEGCQAPSPFGYDYAKIMCKVQFIEAYNIGSSQAIVRSFNPHNAIPAVTTHFNNNSNDSIWQFYYYVANGNRGHIGWVENWFNNDGTPKPWHKVISPALKECGDKLGPLQAGSEWINDGVAIYYSQSSIQMGWIMDAAAHGGTWVNRNSDADLGAAPLVRKAWENMLRDSGVQFNYVSYADVVKNGIPKEYKVLILPATMCLSDIEAKRIEEFCQNGGTVIADYLPGIFDQHGRGRKAGGVLDKMFGVKQNPGLKAKDVWQGDNGWYEVNQDDHYSHHIYADLLSKNKCILDGSGFNKCVRDEGVGHVAKFGQGSAVLMNLSPQWYNAYREAGYEEAKKRDVFMKPVFDAGVKPWVRIDHADGKTFGYEITYWKKGDRTLVFLVTNPEITGGSLGGGNSAGLKTETVNVTLKFNHPITGVRDERADKDLPDGDSFPVTWKMNECVVLSFKNN
ncbi:MAG: beta-galactosidase trimerization domain-containing protein [Planctomycetota bacterium]